jgi:hypothetical protein
MTRYILPLLVAISIAAGSCSGRKNKAEHKDIIPEKDLIQILTEVHLADGLLSVPGISYVYSRGDSLSSYIDIIENHGYTKSQMDRTMRFYFVRKPKKLIRIYDKVLGGLSEMESRIDKELPGIRTGEMNIWPGKSFYSFPDPADENSEWIDFPVNKYVRYHLKFTITIYPDDQSVNPHLGLFLAHSDTAGNEKRVIFSTLPYIKDGQPHTYKVSLRSDLDAPIRLKGWFMNQETVAPWREQHFRVENIILSPYVIE